MPYAITENKSGSTSWRAVSAESDLIGGEIFSATQPRPTIVDGANKLAMDVQCWLDSAAVQNGYDSLASCISYKDSAITQWAADATAAIAWRDAVWQACFQWQQNAQANPPATFPTSAEVIAQLPQHAAYGWTLHAPGAAAANLVGTN